MKSGPNTSSAVMQQRRDKAKASLDDFPTPPWATRALIEHLAKYGADAGWPKKQDKPFASASVLDPACNRGHMVRPLAEAFGRVDHADIADYSRDPARAVIQDGTQETLFEQARICDFLWPWEADFPRAAEPDWVITNPPFRLADQFARRAFGIAREGVALLVRSAFLEGGQRHRDLFKPCPPEWILQFCERVPMVEGRLDPDASTATAYSWLIWLPPYKLDPKSFSHNPAFAWIPPCRQRLERPGDYPQAERRSGSADTAAADCEANGESNRQEALL